MSIYDIKPAFQDLLRPITRWLAAGGVTPNRVTFVAFAMSFVAGGLMFVQHAARWTLLLIPVVLLVVLAIVSEMAGVLAVTIGAGRRYDGPMGKSDRAVTISLLAFFLGIGIEPGRWCDVFLWVCCGLLIVTIGRRVRRAPEDVAP